MGSHENSTMAQFVLIQNSFQFGTTIQTLPMYQVLIQSLCMFVVRAMVFLTCRSKLVFVYFCLLFTVFFIYL